MEAEDLSDLPVSSNSGCKSENDNFHDSNCGPSDADSQPSNSVIKEHKLNGGISGTSEVDVGIRGSLPFLENDTEGDVTGSSSIMQKGVELNGTVTVGEDVMYLSSGIQIANVCVTGQHGSPVRNRKRDGSPNSNHKIDDSSISGVKKARVTVDERQPSVHVMFNSLTRESKRKLEKLLQQWSEWHAQHCSSSHDSNQVLETGEETYFPALRVGLDNNSSVSFWMDNQTRNQIGMEEFNALDSKSVPLYDRGYSLDGGLDIVDASRCFNCSSYGHSMKECPKPRDNAAVNSARKQHKSRRNQNPSFRNPTRYYQNSPSGKYDGLRPGVLDAGTRQLLGLGELDPPPWLNRMREMGYPLGYLDPEDDDQPSGITIFADEESKEGKEDGEILEADHPEPPRKMSVEFPGLNAPIPENADKRRWAAGHSSSDSSRNRSHRRSDHLSEPMSRSQSHEQRWSRDYIDEGPPGCDPGFSPTLSSHSRNRSPSFGRTFSDRGRWSPSVYEDSIYPGSRGSAPYSPPNMRFSPPQNYGSASFETREDDRWSDFNRNVSSHHRRNRW